MKSSRFNTIKKLVFCQQLLALFSPGALWHFKGVVRGHRVGREYRPWVWIVPLKRRCTTLNNNYLLQFSLSISKKQNEINFYG